MLRDALFELGPIGLAGLGYGAADNFGGTKWDKTDACAGIAGD
jgi:hypothetical protein